MSVLKNWQKSFKGNLRILADYFHSKRVRIHIVSYTRSRAAQARLVEFPQGYQAATPGRSQHQYGLAADLSVTPKTMLNEVGSVWQQMGGFWGGYQDPVHFAFFNPSQWASILASCGPKKHQTVINPYGPINAPPIAFPPGGINIPIPPENPNQPILTPPILPNVAVAAISPAATTMAGRGLVTINSPVGPAVMVSVPTSVSAVPLTTARR